MSRDDSDGTYFPEGMPLPGTDANSRPFWSACNEHRLLVQRCAECGVHRAPPQPLCGRCGSFESDWSDSRGRGRVFSYTIVHHTPHPAARERLPYNIAVIELDDCDGVLLVSNVVGCPDGDLRVDLPVEVLWEDRGDGQSLYRFRPADAPASSPERKKGDDT